MAGSAYDLKVVTLGSSGVGKTSIIERFVTGQFSEQTENTIGASFHSKYVEVHGKQVVLNIWDTAGQEKYRAINRLYYKDADACILVFDIGDPDSFKELRYWMRELVQHDTNVLTFIAANKCDLRSLESDYEEVWQFAQTQGVQLLFEVSAKTGHNLDNLFNGMVEMCVDKIDRDAPANSVDENEPLLAREPLIKSKVKAVAHSSQGESDSENKIQLRALVISAQKRYANDIELFGHEGALENEEVMTLNCERHGPYEEEFEFTWNHTFPGDETDLGSEPFDFVCYFLKYPGDARKLQQFIEPYAYVRHRYAKCYGNAVFAPKFVARNNLHVHRGMAGKRGDKAVDDLLARERGFSELVSRVWKKLDKSGEGSIQAENLSSIMSDEEFNSHFSNPLTEAGLRTWWAKGAKGPLLNHIRELTQSDKSILRFFSREIKAFVDPSYYDYNELNRRNISFQLGEEFEVRTSLEMDIKWGLTDEARQAHATELCLDRYAREHVITLYFNLKPGVDVESLKTKINNFIMHLTSARGCIDTRHVGKMVGALLAGPNIYCKVIDNRLALSFSQDVVMAIAGASRNEYNTFHSWYKDFLQIPAVQQTLSGKIETSFSPQTILEQPDVPIFELILQNIKASVKARIWKGWRTFLFEYEKAIPGNIAPIMAWFMLGKADIDVKANSYSDLNSAYIEKLFTKKWPLSMPCYSHIIKRIKQRYNRFIHKHTYLKGISDFIFQNLETEEIEMKVFLQNLQANATLKTQGLEQLLSLKQFEGVDFSKYFN